jgi:hypothetical protein
MAAVEGSRRKEGFLLWRIGSKQITLITALQGQNKWAVVSSTATVVRSFSSAGPVTAAHPATGQYEVTFSKDVSACAYEATIGETAAATPTQGQISVSGDSDPRAGDRLSGLYLVGSLVTEVSERLDGSQRLLLQPQPRGRRGCSAQSLEFVLKAAN